MGRSRLGGKRMTLRKWMRTAACLALTAGMTMAAADDADAKRVRWKMHSAFGGKLIVLGERANNIADTVTEIRSDECRVGQECVRTGRSRWSPCASQTQ